MNLAATLGSPTARAGAAHPVERRPARLSPRAGVWACRRPGTAALGRGGTARGRRGGATAASRAHWPPGMIAPIPSRPGHLVCLVPCLPHRVGEREWPVECLEPVGQRCRSLRLGPILRSVPRIPAPDASRSKPHLLAVLFAHTDGTTRRRDSHDRKSVITATNSSNPGDSGLHLRCAHFAPSTRGCRSSIGPLACRPGPGGPAARSTRHARP